MEKTLYTSRQVVNLLGIKMNDLRTILRPIRSQGKILPPLFKPEIQTKLTSNWIFTEQDVLKMKRYFDALKEYKLARNELKHMSEILNSSWIVGIGEVSRET